jgi:alpha-beta hydrolase superfamily lysophospholipase
MPAADPTFILTAHDGVEIFVYRWLPASAPKAVVQIVHGMSEHAARYARVAAALTASGYAVYASDLRGHGRTAKSPDDLGLFAEHDGWRKCEDDLWQLAQRIAAEHPGLPVIMLAHSLGSTLARQFIAEHGSTLAGVVLSAASGQPTPLATIGRLITRLERMRLGRRGISPLLQSMSFGAFNKRFEPARTPCDWLSRDPAEVDKYVADPLCGFAARVQLWIDLLDAWAAMSKPASMARVPKERPVFVIAGTHDPVSAGARTLQPMLAAYRAAGLKNLSHKFYLEARHELLNETNRDEVTRDLVAWMDGVVAGTKQTTA